MKHDAYTTFGMCWEAADFATFSKKMKAECTYTSFDFFYKLKGKDKLIELFTKQAIENQNNDDDIKINIHKGFCQKTNTMLKTIKECCIMVRQSDMKSIRILLFNKRFGKITSITGLDPDKIKSIRDIRIRR